MFDDVKKVVNKLKKINFSKIDMIVVVILLMVVGYANVSNQIVVKSNALLSVNLNELDCYIGNLFIDSVNRFDSLSNDLSSFTFNMTGKSKEINYYVRNNSTEYDENIKITCSTSGNSDIIEVNNRIETLVSAQSVNSGVLSISKDDTSEKTILCRLTYDNVSRDEIAAKNKAVFYSSEGASVSPAYTIFTGEKTYVNMPTPVKGVSIFLGWKNKNNKVVDETTLIDNYEDEILFADWSVLHAKYTSYDNSSSGSSCTTVQCALDELDKRIKS